MMTGPDTINVLLRELDRRTARIRVVRAIS